MNVQNPSLHPANTHLVGGGATITYTARGRSRPPLVFILMLSGTLGSRPGCPDQGPDWDASDVVCRQEGFTVFYSPAL